MTRTRTELSGSNLTGAIVFLGIVQAVMWIVIARLVTEAVITVARFIWS